MKCLGEREWCNMLPNEECEYGDLCFDLWYDSVGEDGIVIIIEENSPETEETK